MIHGLDCGVDTGRKRKLQKLFGCILKGIWAFACVCAHLARISETRVLWIEGGVFKSAVWTLWHDVAGFRFYIF